MERHLLIDIGNSSTCKIAVLENGHISLCTRTDTGTLAGTAREMSGKYGKFSCICLSSVRNDNPELETALARSCSRFVRISGTMQNLPITIGYSTPETLGADRIAAAAGAHALFPQDDCIVFDFGTAITIDFITRKGHFMGGNISPGMRMRFEAMHHFTNKLPLVSPSTPEMPAGTSTSSAINSGIVLGIMFEVQKYAETFPGHKIIFTGGDAIFFAKKLNYPIFVVCNLIFIGLAHISQIKK